MAKERRSEMRRTVATMTLKGIYKVIYDSEAKVNPYRVYRITGNHKKQIQRYADLGSAMYLLTTISWEIGEDE